MSVVLSLIDATLAFGSLPLLDGAGFTLLAGERVGLIGRNGTGKSTLLNVIAARIELDEGRLVKRDGLRIVYVEQEPVFPPGDSLLDALMERAGMPDLAHADERRYWHVQSRITQYLERLDLDPYADPSRLSGGQTKRAALALAFALEPDLLLLDEPTNHLDIAAIEQLEQLILAGPALIVITHDRRFLDNAVTRILELDRGQLRSFPGSFTAYERGRSEQLAAESVARGKFDKFWAQEEVWIRKGIEARRTRNEGRVRRLEALRAERDQRRERAGRIKVEVDAGERSGKLVCEMVGVSKSLGGQTLISGLDLTIMRGDRVGLIGPNGAGKSTLLRLTLGELEPDGGTIRLGTNLNIAYFDQLREQLDGELSVAQTVSPGSDYVEVNGARRHIMGYLGDFLFAPNRANSPVKTLSGGERNRLLLARLFAKPANLLVMDEPTNDLDLESIELLETTLQGYPGTLMLVSHDRTFLDNVVTSVLVARGAGHWLELVGGYSEWLAARAAADTAGNATASGGTASSATVRPTSNASTAAAARSGRTSLSYKETRELAALPARIESLEEEQKRYQAEMSMPDFFKRPADEIRASQARMAELAETLAAEMARWEFLMDKDAGSA
ncbi:MAG: ATP-binding cassette domain-containing protein [Lautropia sp.]|nr:ATP-binding cassette domain-containing protein [Lautropia sp.]